MRGKRGERLTKRIADSRRLLHDAAQLLVDRAIAVRLVVDLVALRSPQQQPGAGQHGKLSIQCIGRPARQASDRAHMVRLARVQQQQSEDVAPVSAEQ